MELIFKNEVTNQTRKQKGSFATYILISIIPFGGIVTLFMSIIRKQFKLYFLNIFLIFLILGLVISITTAIIVNSGIMEQNNVVLLIQFIFYFLYIFVIFVIAKDINRASIKWYLEHGYELGQGATEVDKLLIEEIKNNKYPWWAIVR